MSSQHPLSFEPSGFLRVATTAPAPKALVAYAPFKYDDAYGYAEHQAREPEAFEAALAACRDLFTQAAKDKAAVGLSRLAAPKAVFFDMDATVIAEESLVELAKFAGKGDEVARITERAMAGEMDFKAALFERVKLLDGLPESLCHQVAQGLTLNHGIKEFVQLCQSRGIKTFMVSGGFTQLCSIIQFKVGFDAIHANLLGAEGGKLTGKVIGEIVDAQGKLQYVRDVCAKYSWDPREVAAVGDGANDRLMMEAVGVAIGHQARPVLYPVIHALNAAGDHRYLAALLFGTFC